MNPPLPPLAAVTTLPGDARQTLRTVPPKSVHMSVTSPPYWQLRSYLPKDHPQKHLEIGSEPTPALYIASLMDVFDRVREALRDDGTVWVNIGDSYSSSSQVGIPCLFAFAMRDRGWLWRDTIIWAKTCAMPSSVDGWRWEKCRVHQTGKLRSGPNPNRRDGGMSDIGGRAGPSATWSDCPGCPKCSTNDGYVLRKGSWRTTTSHEYIFMFAKTEGYYCDAYAVRTKAKDATISRNNYSRITEDNALEEYATKHDHEFNGATANLRSVWQIGPEPMTESVKFTEVVFVSVDDASDDMERIASEDCPVHGNRPASTSLGDALQGDQLTRNRNTETRPAQVLTSSPVPTQDQSLADSEPSSPRVPVATSHSNGKNKKRRGNQTSQSDNSCEEKLPRTDRTLIQPALSVPRHDTQASRIAEDSCVGVQDQPEQSFSGKPCSEISGAISDASQLESSQNAASHISLSKTGCAQDDPSACTLTDSPRKSLCTCSYKKVIIREVSHFASYPSEIPRKAILAGTSAKGVCPKCGAPVVRIVSKSKTVRATDSGYGQLQKQGGLSGERYDEIFNESVGWRPACACNAGEPTPAVVLDPFGGSGRTALTAIALGRRAILCELNDDYVGIQRRQFDRHMPLFTHAEGGAH